MDIHDDHFALFGLPERFDLDGEALERAYRALQSQVHPDRFVGASPAEQRVALQWATRANEAYRTLHDPLRRATYLCRVRGADPTDENDTRMPQAFLMEQLEWREALDDARTAGDRSRIDALAGDLDRKADAIRAEVADALDVAPDAARARGLVRQWMFIAKLRDDLGPAARRPDAVVR